MLEHPDRLTLATSPFRQMGDFSLSSILGHLETSKPASKETPLADPLAITPEDIARLSPGDFGSLGLPEVSQGGVVAVVVLFPWVLGEGGQSGPEALREKNCWEYRHC